MAHPGSEHTMTESSTLPNQLSRWRIYFDRALARDAVGDLMLLVEEAPSPALQLDARRVLARRLLARHRPQLAREQIQALLATHPQDEAARAFLTQLDGLDGNSVRPPSHAQGAAGHVYLFSGHMIDAPRRQTPRFPADKEPVAAAAIAEALDRLQAAEGCLAMCGGACGGDTLFAEACLARGLRIHLYLPFEEPEFLAASVAFAGGRWVDRYWRIASHPRTTVRLMPRELGPPPAGLNPYARNNRWQLSNALAEGPVRFIALWNGQGGDGPGGTKDMVESVDRHGGRSTILNTTTLW